MNFVKGPIAAGINFTAFDYCVSWLRGRLDLKLSILQDLTSFTFFKGVQTGDHPLHHIVKTDLSLVNINVNLVMEYHRTYSEMSHAAWGTAPQLVRSED